VRAWLTCFLRLDLTAAPRQDSAQLVPVTSVLAFRVCKNERMKTLRSESPCAAATLQNVSRFKYAPMSRIFLPRASDIHSDAGVRVMTLASPHARCATSVQRRVQHSRVNSLKSSMLYCSGMPELRSLDTAGRSRRNVHFSDLSSPPRHAGITFTGSRLKTSATRVLGARLSSRGTSLRQL
jgi:hypothetical protein